MRKYSLRIKHCGIALIGTAALSTGLVACSDADSSSNTNVQAASSETTKELESTDASDTESESIYPRTVETVDGQGNPVEITLEQEPERIVSASTTLTGAILALDAPLAGTSGGSKTSLPFNTDEGFAVQWADAAREQGLEETLYEKEPDVEKILGANPDLVVMSSNGGDAATQYYDQIADLVPVIVIDYSQASWEDLIIQLGDALGLEEEADEATQTYEDRVSQVSDAINLPEQPVDIVTGTPDSLMIFNKHSAQGKLFSDIGFELAEIPNNAAPAANEARGDSTAIEPENIPVAITGESVSAFSMNSNFITDEQLKSNPELTDHSFIKNDNLYALPDSAFRIDYFSAMELLDWAEETFA